MAELRFDGRTAIVTGAGANPGLGRAYAMLLAARGADVVVNDIASAATVAAEIRALGGSAVADSHSVGTREGAEAIVRTAIEAFGRLDILVNNAGIASHIPIDEIGPDEARLAVEVNLMGQFWACRAAWPHMRAGGYGRIVNISSAAFAGSPLHPTYGMTKGGAFSLARSLASDGAAVGIKVNIVNPGAFTTMVEATLDPASSIYQNARAHLPAELVAPVIAYLAHENCLVTGECYEAAGGSVRRIVLSRNGGISDTALTIETVAQRWGEINDMAGSSEIPVDFGKQGDWLLKGRSQG